MEYVIKVKVFHVVFCILLIVIYMKSTPNQSKKRPISPLSAPNLSIAILYGTQNVLKIPKKATKQIIGLYTR